MPQRHTIEVGIVVKDDGSVVVEGFNENLEKTETQLKEAEKAGGKFGASFDNFVKGAYQRAGQMATEFLSSLPGQVVELGKLGAQAQAAELRFERFAGSTENAEAYLQAFGTATDGTVDKMGAMSSAARLLQMGLVDNADEMGMVAEMATKLGDQTMGATERIADFSAMMANQSIPRLDNFGISSGRVRARIEELQKATANLSREEAFKIAVMEEGSKSLAKLGDTSELAQVKIDKVTAALQDAKVGLGEIIVNAFDAGLSVDDFARRLRALPDTIMQVAMLSEATGAAFTAWKNNIFDVDGAMEVFDNTLKVLVASQTDFKVASEETRYAYTLQQEGAEAASQAMINYQNALASGVAPVGESTIAQNQYAAAIASSTQAAEAAISVSPRYLEILEEQRLAAADAAIAQNNLAISLKDASQTQIAQQALTDLNQMYKDGKIDQDTYNEAARDLMLTFGLATEDSINLVTKMQEWNQTLQDGTIDAATYTDGLTLMNSTATTGRDTIIEFTQAQTDAGISTRDTGIAIVETKDAIADLTVGATEAIGRTDTYRRKMSDLSTETIVARQETVELTAALNAIASREWFTTVRIRKIEEVVSVGGATTAGFDRGYQTGFNGMVGPGFGGPRRMLVGEGATPERVLVQPITNNNLTVNTRATTASVIQDFDLMNSMGPVA